MHVPFPQKFMNMFKITHGAAALQNQPAPELFQMLISTDDFDVEENHRFNIKSNFFPTVTTLIKLFTILLKGHFELITVFCDISLYSIP